MPLKVLLSTAYNAQKNYVDALGKYGFALKAEYLPSDFSCDALVLCGGGDIAPEFYNEKNSGSNPPDIVRDKVELLLFEKYFALKKPIIGICRGCQLINVALGGNLIQHLSTSQIHVANYVHDAIHDVCNLPASSFYHTFGSTMTVNSAHHQSCLKIGDGLAVTQVCDAVVEGIEGQNIIGFQWHPERMCGRFSNNRFSDHITIFEIIKNKIYQT